MQNNSDLEKRLWDAADQLRANSELSSHQYSIPVLGLIFLKFADVKFTKAMKNMEMENTSGRRTIEKTDYQAKGILFYSSFFNTVLKTD